MHPAPAGTALRHDAIWDDDAVIRLRLALARLARRQRQAAPTGLTQSQQSALAMVDRHGPLSLGRLAELEQVAPPTLTRIVAKLEEQDLLRRRVDEGDRRVALVEITEAGHERLTIARQHRNRWLRERLAVLDGGDRAALLAAVGPLERLADADPEAIR